MSAVLFYFYKALNIMTLTLILGLHFIAVPMILVGSDKQKDYVHSLTLILQNIYNLEEKFLHQGKEMLSQVDERFDGVMEELQYVGEKLQHISAVVKAIERRFKLAELCPPGICGETGVCDLSDRPGGYQCMCDSIHHGEHCELEYGPCETRFREYKARGMLPGMELPRCDHQGYYLGMQFLGSMAVCFTREGDVIQDYSVPRWKTGENMDCMCAREQFAHSLSGQPEQLFSCLPNGNYAS